MSLLAKQSYNVRTPVRTLYGALWLHSNIQLDSMILGAGV